MACAIIYARFQRACGNFSGQLVFARSKIIPAGTTQPSAELIAVTLNAHTGKVVRRSLKKYHEQSIKLADSQIVLYGINSDKQLKPWVRNRVLEIQRFNDPTSWKFVKSQDMVADIRTRRGVKLEDVSQESTWINVFPWMCNQESDFPTKSINEIKLDHEDIRYAKKEQIIPSFNPENLPISLTNPIEPMVHQASIKEHFLFSKYLVDSNKYGWNQSIRIISMVFKFIKIKCKPKKLFLQSNDELTINYYFSKATKEIQYFTPEKKYSKITNEKNGILYYTEQILPTKETLSTGRFTNAMLDLNASSFIVPMVDRYSPIAFSIVNYIHWYHPGAKHACVETVYRFVLQIVYIIDGRELIKSVQRKCERCRYLAKRTIEVEMGPVSKHCTNIAPPFYSTQVDLCGPFSAFSNHNRRTTIKIWLVVYCCTTTSATKINVMDDYSTPAFVLSFTRFASNVGYPKYLLPDEGSQMVKACKTMQLNFTDIQNQLQPDIQVKFEVCPVSGHFIQIPSTICH